MVFVSMIVDMDCWCYQVSLKRRWLADLNAPSHTVGAIGQQGLINGIVTQMGRILGVGESSTRDGQLMYLFADSSAGAHLAVPLNRGKILQSNTSGAAFV